MGYTLIVRNIYVHFSYEKVVVHVESVLLLNIVISIFIRRMILKFYIVKDFD